MMYTIAHLSRGNLDEIETVAKAIGSFDPKLVKKVVKILNKFKAIIAPILKDKRLKTDATSLVKETIANSINDALGFTEIFTMFDKDNSGLIDFNEFTELCKYMGLFLNR